MLFKSKYPGLDIPGYFYYDMKYIYRILWLIFYIPVLAVELVAFVLGFLLFLVAFIVCVVIKGDIESIPDQCIPGYLSMRIDGWYQDIRYKLW